MFCVSRFMLRGAARSYGFCMKMIVHFSPEFRERKRGVEGTVGNTERKTEFPRFPQETVAITT